MVPCQAPCTKGEIQRVYHREFFGDRGHREADASDDADRERVTAPGLDAGDDEADDSRAYHELSYQAVDPLLHRRRWRLHRSHERADGSVSGPPPRRVDDECSATGKHGGAGRNPLAIGTEADAFLDGLRFARERRLVDGDPRPLDETT